MIYFQPEFRNQQGEIINVIDAKGKAVGYIAYMYNGEDLYVMGQLDNEGEKQNYLDITSRYIEGLKKSILLDGEKEPNLFIHLGGEEINYNQEEQDKE